MKWNTTRILCALIGALCLTCAALAAETYPTVDDLYQHWCVTEMPDWVCSVSSTDGSMENLTVVVNSQAGADELASMVEDPSGMDVILSEGSYSHNELMAAQEAITEKYMAPDGPVVSIGTGWAVIDGEVTGFGESGRESRVVVGIPEEYAEEYGKLLEKQYGDMVYVERSEGAVTYETSMQEATATSAPVSFLPWVCFGALLLGATAALLKMRKKLSAAK